MNTNNISGCPDATLEAGERKCGFRVLRIEQIPEIRITAYEMEHERTGARVLHLHCVDSENLYSLCLRTPPQNSAGVAHILEHCVLAGSEKYPLKDVFNELAKGSLQTFINAFTYPDKTIYPVASQVRTDFFNLARVYTDLVLRPRLLKQTFLQEGHHLEFENPEDVNSNLMISGVVYNEMKGAYSSPDTLMYKPIQQKLYPDTAYAFDSGGDPEIIPMLSYDELAAFHRTFYSPSNARFLLYGNIPTEDHLRFLQEVLAGFGPVPVDSAIQTQRRWRQPSKTHNYYPVGKEEDLTRKTAVNVAWMMVDNTDDETVLLLKILSQALVGSAAGPLRKALIDSGLGEDLSPVTGFEQDFRQVAFAVGLRGTDSDKAERVEALILETLKQQAESGLDSELIEGALHQVEFHGKEIVRSHVPYAVHLMDRIYRTWLYDGDPLVGLKFSALVERIRRRWEEEPRLFQQLMHEWFLDNPHRLLSVTEPSKTYGKEGESHFKERMKALKASLPREKLEDIAKEAAWLRQAQTEPDSPEALNTLPRLQLSEIPRTIERIPAARKTIAGVPTTEHNIFANGIAYLDVAFDVSDVPEDLQLYLPLLGKLTTGMGAAGQSYEEMAKRKALKTGGIGCRPSAGMTIDRKGCWQKVIVRLKALHRNVLGAVKIASDVLTHGDLTYESRMQDLVAEAKNQLHSSVIPSGHAFAHRTAAAGLSVPAYREEQWFGRTQLRLLNQISDRFHDRKGDLREKLAKLRHSVFRRERLVANLTGDAEGLALLSEGVEALADCLPSGGSPGRPGEPELQPVRAGISIPAQVCYVAKAMKAASYSEPLSASLLVLSKELSTGYLYQRIRVQGGAYGGMSQYDPLNGSFSFLSYRDPNLVETLKVYDSAVQFACEHEIDEEALHKAIIGTIGSLDKPMDPSGKGYISMIREFAGLTDEDRQVFRNEVLETSPASLMEAANRYLKPAAKLSAVAVYAMDERLHQANETVRPKLKIENLL